MADSLGINDAHGGMLPQQKLAFVQQLQSQGARVLMVGDGVNDAAVLRAADVSFAMGSGAALAQSHADAVLLSASLSSLIDAAEAATACMKVIRQNLAWATFYNLVAIPAAAFGLLVPWMAGLGMSLSSAGVVLNALRLERLPCISPFTSPFTFFGKGSLMEALYVLIPLSVAVVFVALWVFFRAMDGGQFDDLEGPGMRILQDDDRAHAETDESQADIKK